MKKLSIALLAATALAALASPAVADPKVELIHMWTSGDSAAALASLKDRFVAAGGEWIDSAASGATAGQMATLRARVLAGDAPTASQLEGPAITEWAVAGQLANLDEVADAEGWDAVMPDALKTLMKYDGHYVAVPLNMHRINWIYYNPTLLKELGLEYPKTWEELNAAVDKAQAAGYQGLSHGGRPWQDLTLFEAVALGQGGVDFFKKAFYDLDDETLRGETMVKVFAELRHLVGTFDEAFQGRHYSESLKLVGQKKALFTVMGDWALATLLNDGYVYGTDFACAAVPQDDGRKPFTLNTDSFGFFKQTDPDRIEGQKLVAKMTFDPQTQIEFNLKKGSIPARLGVDLTGFADCQQKSSEDLKAAMADDSLLLSFAQNMAQPQSIQGPAEDVVTTFVATPDTTAEEGARLLADAIAANK
jgi:glucose/mannose transport system substrate-binding protein